MNAWKTAAMTGAAVSIIAVGSSEQAAAGIDAGGTSRMSKGTVTALGGVHVNGVHFNTDAARFLIDGVDGAETDLEVGKVVTVLGVIDTGGETGKAYLVVYDPVVRGPVDAIDPARAEITVLGQTVVVNADTSYALGGDHTVLTAAALGEDVEVSGYRDAYGRIVASYLGTMPAASAYTIEGVVTSSDPATMTFAIDGLEVDYSRSAYIDVPGGMPGVGQRLEIAGTKDPSAGRLEASRVVADTDGIDAGGVTWQPVDGIDAGGTDGIDAGGIDGIDAGGIDGIDAGGIDGIDAGGINGIDAGGIDGIDAGGIDGIDAGGIDGIDAGGINGIDAGGISAEIEGHIQALPGATAVTVDGTELQLAAETQFVNGDAADLALNSKVEVTGSVTAGGVIIAERIEFERHAEERLLGRVDSVRDDSIVVDGVSLGLTAETSYRDLSAAAAHRFTARDLSAGDRVEILGYRAGDRFIVTRVDRRDPVYGFDPATADD